MNNSKTVVTASGTIKVTIEQIEAPDGSIIYRAHGRRLGQMVYTRNFDSFKELGKFVNRSAGQSLRRERVRSFTTGYRSALSDFHIAFVQVD